MEEDKLIKYLKDVVDLETQKRIAENTLEKFQQFERDNEYVRHVDIGTISTSQNIMKKIKWLPFVGKLYLGTFIAIPITLLIKGILMFICMFININFSDKNVEAFSMIVGLSVVWIWIIKKEISKAHQSAVNEQNSKLQYIEKVKTGRSTLAQIQNDRPNLLRVQQECGTTLRRLYELNIVHPEYQYLEACGMFLQYLSTGRTHSLQQIGGDAGAYNLYENDLKYNGIKRQLNEVLKNQQILYGVMTEINNNVENLYNSVKVMERYAQQTAYNTKISAWCNTATAINTYAMRRMQEEYIFYR